MVFQSAAVGVGATCGVVVVVSRLISDKSTWVEYGVSAFTAGVLCWGVASGLVGGAWTLLILVGLVLLDVPVAAAIGVTGAMLVSSGNLAQAMSVFVGQELNSIQDVAFIALPLFMLLGGLVAKTGLAADLGRFLTAVLGWIPGGVGLSCVAAAGILANMTGSPIADTATLGNVFLPELIKSGYTRAEAGALQACAGLLGLVFPPAIVLIIWATVVNVSVTAQFAAVLVPGAMLMVMMMAIVVLRGLLRGGSRVHRPQPVGGWPREIVRAGGLAAPVVAIPVILDVGIFSGVFAAYEAGAVALVVAGGIGAARGRVRLRHFVPVVTQAADTTVLVMIILASVGILQYGLFISGVDRSAGHLLGLVAGSTLGFWVVVNLAFMILHEFVEPIPAILLLAPFVVPLAVTVHVGLLQLGVVIVVNSTIGLVLPPLGVNLYVAAELAGARSTDVLRRVWPYLLGSLGVLVLVSALPALTAL
jgi:C4-dicarboxylate transporter DctM subunit